MSYTFEQVDEALVRIQKNHPEIEEVIVFYREILKKQLQIKSSIHLPPFSLADAKAKGKFEHGIPLLELSLVPDSLKVYEPLVKELTRLLKKRGPAVTAEIEKITKDILRDSYIFISLANNYLLHNWAPIHDLARAHELDIALLFFFIKSIVKPFVESLAEGITTSYQLPPWSESLCPICGSLPALAYLKLADSNNNDNGQEHTICRVKKRFLVCSLCNYIWPFPRLRCPFCQTERRDALHYFCVDSDEKGYRVDICTDCKGYIKTIDYEYQPLPEGLLFLEDLNTIYLDLIAEKEGYCKKAKGIFSL
ncbi:MAG: formate dehydrogenase accessory protein FdhE [bacterium]